MSTDTGDAKVTTDVADSHEGREKPVISVPLVGTVPTSDSATDGTEQARMTNASTYVRLVPGRMSHDTDIDLTEAEAQVIYAMRRSIAAESSWQAFDGEEAWRVLRDDVEMFEGRLDRDGYESHLLHIAGIACHAFIEGLKAQNERFRATMRKKAEGGQVEEETQPSSRDDLIESGGQRGEQIITLLSALLAELNDVDNWTVEYLNVVARDELPALAPPFTRRYACAATAAAMCGADPGTEEDLERYGNLAQAAFPVVATIMPHDAPDVAMYLLQAVGLAIHRFRRQETVEQAETSV